MGATLRNVLILLFFALLATKGIEFFANVAKNQPAENVRHVTEQDRDYYAVDEAYAASDQMVLRAQRHGHFTLQGAVDGTPVQFMVDTGASMVVLSPADATRVGLSPSRLEFNGVAETGNGRTPVALVTLDHLSIGSLDLYDVEAAVITKPMSMSLLGMSALGRLDGYEVDGDRMVLRW